MAGEVASFYIRHFPVSDWEKICGDRASIILALDEIIHGEYDSNMPNLKERNFLNASWLINLRWVAVIGQVATIAGAIVFFHAQIPAIWALIVVISLTAFSNVLLTIWFARDRRIRLSVSTWNVLLGLVMVMDMLSLTALLFATGGPNNPFFLFIFVNISLSALVLNRNWAWGINLLANVCFLLITFEHLKVAQLDMGLNTLRSTGTLPLKHIALLVAFAACSSVIVYFMTRLTAELRAQQLEVRNAQLMQAHSEKIEALGTLAAGTAHELATPLSTIAIVAKDVEQAFELHPPDFPGAEEVIEDVHLIRSQLDRCRAIIDRMSSHAGEAVGETIRQCSLGRLAEASLEGLIGRGRVHLDISAEDENAKVSVPIDGLSQAIRGLVQNALDADPSDRPVVVSIRRKGENWRWEIIDRGPGMPPEVLQRVSEPFFTTKSPGKGMGLGVFLAKNVVRRLGGTVSHTSRRRIGDADSGTTVTITLPYHDPQ